jgi:hypothetical protein
VSLVPDPAQKILGLCFVPVLCGDGFIDEIRFDEEAREKTFYFVVTNPAQKIAGQVRSRSFFT